MSLKDDILNNPACASALANRDCVEIARIVSEGRTQPNNVTVGNGGILRVLGIAAGNSLLDVLYTNPDFRYVKPLVEQGRLEVGTPLVQGTIQGMVSVGILTQIQADTLCALGKSPYPYTPQEISEALYNPDGSNK